MGAVLVFAGLAAAALLFVFTFVFAIIGLVLKLAIRVILFPLFLIKSLVMGVVQIGRAHV